MVGVMFLRYYYRLFWLLFLLICSSCTPAAPVLVEIPTRAVLPTATTTPTETPSLTNTPLPSETPTLNLLETQVAQLNATNAAAQMTLAVFQATPTATLTVALTPTLTITTALTPSGTSPGVVPMQPVLVYAKSVANLRTCPHRDCEQIAQLQSSEAVMATGTIEGEAINTGKPLWYRVDYGGRALYVYGELVSPNAPATNPPIFAPPVSTIPPPVGSVGCPSLSATCSMMTCEQAYACLAAGNASLDRDHDGVPCESVCNP
jgi:hypothetical protein